MTKAEEFHLQNFVIGICRRSFKQTPMYRETKDAAKRYVEVINVRGKKETLVHYECANCKRLFREKGVEEYLDENGQIKKRRFTAEIAVDHIDPVVPVTGWVNFDDFITRHYLGRCQVLCNYKGKRDGVKACHKIKTAEENNLRRINAKLKKK